jgi:hypothetical protein
VRPCDRAIWMPTPYLGSSVVLVGMMVCALTLPLQANHNQSQRRRMEVEAMKRWEGKKRGRRRE